MTIVAYGYGLGAPTGSPGGTVIVNGVEVVLSTPVHEVALERAEFSVAVDARSFTVVKQDVPTVAVEPVNAVDVTVSGRKTVT